MKSSPISGQTDRFSLHLTIGVRVYRWADLLDQALIDITRQDARFRESLPLTTLLTPEQQEKWKEMVGAPFNGEFVFESDVTAK